MFEKLPFWGQVLVFACLSCVIVAMAYYFYPNLAEKEKKIVQIKDEYAEMEHKIREGRAIEAKLPEFEREIASLERKLGDIQQILPSTPETGDLLRWIKNLADQSNLDLKSFAPGQMEPAEFYKRFPIAMDVVGRYHDLGVFLDRVSKYSRIINVDNMSINQNNTQSGDKTIRSNFTATTFVYDEKVGSQASGEVVQ